MLKIKLLLILNISYIIGGKKDTENNKLSIIEKKRTKKIFTKKIRSRKDQINKVPGERVLPITNNIFHEKEDLIYNNDKGIKDSDYTIFDFDKLINNNYTISGNSNLYYHIENINKDTNENFKKLVIKNLKEAFLAEIFLENNIDKIQKLFLYDSTFVTALPTYSFIDNKNQNGFLENIINRKLSNNISRTDIEAHLKKEFNDNYQNIGIIKKCRNFSSLNKVKDFLKNKKGFTELDNIHKESLINNGVLNLITFKKENNDYIFNYIREDYTSIYSIYEILLDEKIINTQEDFITLISLGNKSTNILHFENLIEYYFKHEDIFPLGVKFIITHRYNENFNILDNKKYIYGIEKNFNQDKKNIHMKNKFIKNNFILLDEISKVTIEYLKKEKLEEKNNQSKLNV